MAFSKPVSRLLKKTARTVRSELDIVHQPATPVPAVRIAYQFVRRPTAKEAARKLVSLSGFMKRFAAPLRSARTTIAQYERMSPSRKAQAKGAAGAFIPALFARPTRVAADIEAITMLAFDFDDIEPDLAARLLDPEAAEPADPLTGITFIAHTTRSHGPDDPHVRLIIPIHPDTWPTPEKKAAIAHWVARTLGVDDVVDRTCYRPAQLAFFPTVSSDQEYRARLHVPEPRTEDGAAARAAIPTIDTLLDAKAIEAAILEDHDSLDDIIVADGVPAFVAATEQRDPRERPGPAGAFNRWVGDVVTAIERFLDDVYEPADADADRWRHRSSKGPAGAVILSDGQRLYSHHGTDPASGRARDAFDLVRIHLFGKLDSASPAAPEGQETAYTDLPSYQAMVEWLYDPSNEKTERFRRFEASEALKGLDDDPETAYEGDAHSPCVRRKTILAGGCRDAGGEAPRPRERKPGPPPSPPPGSLSAGFHPGHDVLPSLTTESRPDDPVVSGLARLFSSRRRAGQPVNPTTGSTDVPPARQAAMAHYGLAEAPFASRKAFLEWYRPRMQGLLAGLGRDRKGNIRPSSPENLALLSRHPLFDLFFTTGEEQAPRLAVPAEWLGLDLPLEAGDQVADSAVATIGLALAVPPACKSAKPLLACGVRATKQTVHDLVDVGARRAMATPDAVVRWWLDGIEWDGTSRLRRLFPELLGTPDDEYHREAGEVFFLGLVSRVMEPGAKFDYMLVVQGRQGIGKSTFARLLPPSEKLFATIESTHPQALSPKTVMEETASAIVVELPEMASLSHASVEAIKSFITRQEDNARPAYARKAVVMPRRFVTVGTTNEVQLFSDDTGNRRFLLVRMRAQLDVDRLVEWRPQLWAEALALWREGRVPVLSRDAARAQEEMNEAHRKENPMEVVGQYVSRWVFEPGPLFEWPDVSNLVLWAEKHELLPDGVSSDDILDADGWLALVRGSTVDARLASWDPWKALASTARGRAIYVSRWLSTLPVFELRRVRVGGGATTTYYRAILLDHVKEPYAEFARRTGIVARDWVPEEVAMAWQTQDFEWFGCGERLEGEQGAPSDGRQQHTASVDT